MSSRKPLLEYIRASKQASLAYHKIMALPLLPPGLINSAFGEIRSKISLMDSDGKFVPFLNYFEKQWIRKVSYIDLFIQNCKCLYTQTIFQIGCNNFTVHNQKTRTTSAVEAYNGVLGRSADKNGNFFKFVAVIRDEEYFKSRHFFMLTESGGSLCKKKKKQDVKRHSQIEEATLLLNQGRITAATFLSRMVYEANEVCVDMVTKLDIFQEAEDSDCEMSSEEEVAIDVESSTGHDCVVCEDKPSNVVMIPCKHLKICTECNLKLLADSNSKGLYHYNCPYCRTTVEDTMEVFT